mmetsp:Transcript_51954/g.126731  ORF Transcript_51954/g.126731 Transcript_51954/m.126731 type:complete len:364 (+) Transcript_51954:256-1347(+)|eukprot:CAMPEP_0206236346 /NCGR_PEP_ID=MMETSP0047_2-20121206/13667_1 /ASSEMBLY_ACC=CAM_ASM_000192 /TAXON_ID=195065 /ORGANISM="Chroomonas mesostigmatica_cf, Strain CCMP1168" /LENGTH=363 /DNA_ID=CAMNT_0053660677 /DNA_START=184 /DNA_END=1275 /DNA_ORIENTATION=-
MSTPVKRERVASPQAAEPAPAKRQRVEHPERKARPPVGSMQWVASEQWASPGQIHKLLRKYKNAKTSTRKSKASAEKAAKQIQAAPAPPTIPTLPRASSQSSGSSSPVASRSRAMSVASTTAAADITSPSDLADLMSAFRGDGRLSASSSEGSMFSGASTARSSLAPPDSHFSALGPLPTHLDFRASPLQQQLPQHVNPSPAALLQALLNANTAPSMGANNFGVGVGARGGGLFGGPQQPPPLPALDGLDFGLLQRAGLAAPPQLSGGACCPLVGNNNPLLGLPAGVLAGLLEQAPWQAAQEAAVRAAVRQAQAQAQQEALQRSASEAQQRMAAHAHALAASLGLAGALPGGGGVLMRGPLIR